MISHSEYAATAPSSNVEANDFPTTSCRQTREVQAIYELNVMLLQERTNYSNTFDYLAFESLPEDCTRYHERVSAAWRRKICEWTFEVVDHFEFDREVVSIALSYLDRVVSLKTKHSGEPMHRRDFQLVAVTCLYLAIKLHGEVDSYDGPRRKLKIHAFVELSRGLFTVETLAAKEREILELLEWKVNPPTTVRIVATLLRLLPDCDLHDAPDFINAASAVYERARYLTELSVCVTTLSFNYASSEIAYASILCAMDALQHKVHIPHGVKVEFFNRISEATNLIPMAVEPIRVLLIELCPSMFAFELSRCESNENIESSESDGKSSPVSIMNPLLCAESPRKRGRHHST